MAKQIYKEGKMKKWSTGIFTSIDEEGLGAGLDAVKELGVKTVHLHAPTVANRTTGKICLFFLLMCFFLSFTQTYTLSLIDSNPSRVERVREKLFFFFIFLECENTFTQSVWNLSLSVSV